MSDTDYDDDGDPEGGEWGTPAWLWEPLGEALGGFDVDPATNDGHARIAEVEITPADDGTATPWDEPAHGGDVDVFVNPPYGRQENPEWAETFAGETERPGIRSITALVPAATGTAWWHDYYAANARLVTFIPERLTFNVVGGEESEHNATFGSAIVTYEREPLPGAYYSALADHGRVYTEVFADRVPEGYA